MIKPFRHIEVAFGDLGPGEYFERIYNRQVLVKTEGTLINNTFVSNAQVVMPKDGSAGAFYGDNIVVLVSLNIHMLMQERKKILVRLMKSATTL